MTIILVLNTVWLAGGLVAGYILGWVANHRNGTRRENFRALLGLLLLVLIGFSAYLSYRNAQLSMDNARDLKQEVDCQRNFNENYRIALDAQLSASAQEIQAQKDLMTEFSKYVLIPPDVRATAFAEYFAKIDTIEKSRTAHPLAVINTCGPVS